MADLDISLDELTDLVAGLGVVRREFDGAEEFAAAVAELVGHDGLASAVRDFAAQWNLRRGEILEELDQVAEAAQAIRDTMIELDQELTTVLAGYRPRPAGASGGGGGGAGR